MNNFGFYYNPMWDMQRMNSTNMVNYVVQKGDSLYKIAKKYNVTVDDLIKTNNLKDSLIYPDQIIVIPKRVNNGSVFFEEYVIMDGDTIEGIAMKTQTSTDDIVRYNDVSKLMLVPMQKINIPSMYKKYEIVATDTLDYILRKTGMTAEELINANSNDWLKVGNIINVKY